ncbi:MAG: bifunctional methylenetetrahydrofolate dehydrogenase/methenyltetrahydrofolate cyclohydrolase FolD [Clostridiales bacterium]|nr:bifunctional methylenetetrahydrofolate dehydrogenase/methenyltetrahydrofolate cyclohydrolase FolD [Clostridiales bacterium]
MAKIIDGKAISAEIRAEIAAEVASMEVKPGLSVVIVGEDPASKVYVRNKHKACSEVGIRSEVIELPETTTQEELDAVIDRLNADPSVNGILCQLPLPKHLSEDEVIARIDPKKDVDAFSAVNVGHIMLGDPVFLPCTPAGVMELLRRSGIEVSGKNCVMVGRSNIVGKPMAMLLMKADGTVTVCHTKTADLKSVTLGADILVVAMKKARYIKADMVKEGAVVIDVGMNRDGNGKLCGDVDFDSVSEKAGYITPVPGGVGPMTITMLLRNTVTAARMQSK